jgi:hypothetical protein
MREWGWGINSSPALDRLYTASLRVSVPGQVNQVLQYWTGTQLLSMPGQVIRCSQILDRLYADPLQLYAGLQYWTGSTQLLSVPGQVSQVICRSPVLDIGSTQLLSVPGQASQ